jgi:GDP-mannose 6-dehydrogenase
VNISVFGLGYVGSVTAACLSRDGHSVVGVDANPDKAALIGAGKSPIIEPSLAELLEGGVKNKRLTATTNASAAVEATTLSMVSVGTPPGKNGNPDLEFVHHVCREIAEAVRKKGHPHVVVLRSTVPPGTLATCRNEMETIAGKKLLHVAFNPEFLREGSAIADYDAPPYTIIGTSDSVAEAAVREMYQRVPGPVLVVAPEVAELVKYVANSWHALKIGFANEVGRLARSFDVDGRQVMSLISQDTKLNISPAYLRPGFAFGGSCLPKDLSAITSIAQTRGVPVPLLNALHQSNQVQIDLAVADVLRGRPKRVAVFGLAFKPGTDDLRESPAVALVKRLIGEGCEVRIFDRDVHLSHLMGTNLAYIRATLPHFEAFLTKTPEEALAGADVVVLTYASAAFREPVTKHPNVRVVDLAGTFAEPPPVRDYRGSAW